MGRFRISNMKIALTGGGTLGHVIPALSVAEELGKLSPESSFFYIGSRKELEKEKVEEKGITFFPISSGKLRRYFSFENFLDFFRVFIGFFSSLRILRRERPDVLFSKGGYVSVPVVAAAHFLGIRCVTHESDRSLGLANRLNARYCDMVCLGFENKELDTSKYVYTGNPVRSDLVAIKKVEKENLILILGGSQGASEINNLVYENIDALCAMGKVVHQAGRLGDFSIKHENYTQLEFISSELPSLMSKARVVISRAGAGAISELMYIPAVSVLLPLGLGASRGDQIENAAFLEREKAALVLKDKKDFLALVKEAYYTEDIRRNIESNAERIAIKDAALRIAKVVLGEK